MTSPFVAEIRIFAGNFAPTGWATCDGQLLPISQNTALFSLLGTFYGGDGKSTFALPNLQGSTAVGTGQGPGLSEYFLGQSGGSDFVTLIESEMPAHTHTVRVSNQQGDVQQPTPAMAVARPNGATPFVPGSPVPPLTPMAFQQLSPAGGSLPHNNLMPYLTLTYIIAMQGVFPPRG
jgi:microcystin-dependent protein